MNNGDIFSAMQMKIKNSVFLLTFTFAGETPKGVFGGVGHVV
jgi:hypothetical protein